MIINGGVRVFRMPGSKWKSETACRGASTVNLKSKTGILFLSVGSQIGNSRWCLPSGPHQDQPADNQRAADQLRRCDGFAATDPCCHDGDQRDQVLDDRRMRCSGMSNSETP